MATKKILTIGFSLYGNDTEYCEFGSETSLLDWDIILIQPDISDYSFRGSDYFQGKKRLSDHDSFTLKSKTEHWKREIKTAIDHGKQLFYFWINFKRYISLQVKSNIQEQERIGK